MTKSSSLDILRLCIDIKKYGRLMRTARNIDRGVKKIGWVMEFSRFI